ncbi:MAG: pyridoxal phosphate-dependent aminotransferase family protein [Sphingobacteriales bacterium]|nr:pyridoxal phosphate-dependent aminotransferase family protein [Sphingobacteriales bacterium]
MYFLNQKPGRTAIVDGEEYLFFSGYSYLGMSYVEEFTSMIKEGMDKYGLLHPSSRISNTRLSLYKPFEEKIAALMGMEACVSFSSGYLSGHTIANVLSTHPFLFVSPYAHPAVTPAGKSSSLDFEHWKKEMLQSIEKNKPAEIALITDSINTSIGKIHDFSFLNEIPATIKVICLVDDSHGIGLLGENGEGIISILPKLPNVEYIINSSLSKAFHLEGGAVCCSAYWADKIRQQHSYTGSTPIMPAFAHTFLNAAALYDAQRKKLYQNINYLVEKIKELDGVNHYGLPIFVLHSTLTEEVFRPNKIIISSFGYPDPDNDKNNRVVLNALHTASDLNRLASAIRSKV